MSNPEEGQVTFEADGKTWTLEINNRAERSLQKKLGRPMTKIVNGLGEGDAECLQGIFVSALQKHHPDLTEDRALDLVRPKRLRDLVGAVLKATYGADDEDPKEPAQVGETGSAS